MRVALGVPSRNGIYANSGRVTMNSDGFRARVIAETSVCRANEGLQDRRSELLGTDFPELKDVAEVVRQSMAD